MGKLTKEEVLHVAHLARIAVTDEEIDKYQVELKQLLNEVDKIKDIDIDKEELLVTPVGHESVPRSDECTHTISFDEVKKNVPSSMGNFVEVPVMINE